MFWMINYIGILIIFNRVIFKVNYRVYNKKMRNEKKIKVRKNNLRFIYIERGFIYWNRLIY